MPFTVSHVAAVIPLIGAARVRRLAEPWALAAGAMVPDLPLFLPLGEYREWHSPAGIALRCLPAGLVLLALFQYVLRDPLTALLPPPLAARVAALERPGWRRAPAMAAGVLAGAVTHVLWDSFTHSWGWAWLSAPVAGTLPAYKLAQYASTAGGLAVVAWWCGRGLTAVAPVPRAPSLPAPVRRGVTGLAVTAGVAWVWLAAPPDPALGLPGLVVRGGIGAAVGAGAVLAAYALIWHGVRALRGEESGWPTSTQDSRAGGSSS